MYSFLISGPTYSHHLIDRRVTFGLGRISPNSSETIQTIAIEKIADWKKLEILVQNLSFDILSVHDLLQATSGEITQQES